MENGFSKVDMVCLLMQLHREGKVTYSTLVEALQFVANGNGVIFSEQLEALIGYDVFADDEDDPYEGAPGLDPELPYEGIDDLLDSDDSQD